MPTTLSLHNLTQGILHWSVTRPYGSDQIDALRDPQGGQTEKQPTSIPSPFARMDLVRSAFLNLAKRADLLGTVNDRRLVSDAFDVGELFFNFDTLKKFITITAWDANYHLGQLLNSPNQGHKRLGEALRLFLDQDRESFNFDKIQRLFMLSYRGKIIGGTSPKTLFFSSGNDLSWVDVRFGNHKLFDVQPWPLHERDIEYQKFWYTLQVANPGFRRNFPELDQYLTRSRDLLRQSRSDLFYQHIEMPNGQSLLSADTLYADFEELTTGQASDVIEVLGFPLAKKKANTGAIEQVSDFIIKSDKYAQLYPNQRRPMVLQNNFYRPFTYVPQARWDPKTPVPFAVNESWRDNQRPLPGQPDLYPWLTVSDFLEPYLIRLRYPINRERFFDGNLNAPAIEKGYLLPLKKDFFDFFDVQDLLEERVRLRMEPLASGIKVTLDIPVMAPGQPGSQFVTFERIYNQPINPNSIPIPDLQRNDGVIVEDSFTVNIYPFIRSGRVTLRPDYRIQLIESGYQKRNQYTLEFYEDRDNKPVAAEPRRTRTSRLNNPDASSDYYVLRHEFDYARTSIRVEGHDMTGLLIPRWTKYEGGGKRFAFAVDFGTTNTHIEYSVDNQSPRPFDMPENLKQVGTLVHPDYYNASLADLFILYDLEFVPNVIGPGAPDSFPTRTAIAESKGLDFNQTTYTLADLNIPFYIERQPAGPNEVTPNLKWARDNQQTSRRVRAFLEELMLLIKNKVLSEGGDLSQTTVYWFYPASMTPGRIAQFQQIWRELYHAHISAHEGAPQPVSESIAPFYFYRQTNPLLSSAARPVVNIDIGGGTSDVVIYERDHPILLTSFRFAGNAVYGDAFSDFGAAENNGFVQRYKGKIQNLLNRTPKLKENNDRILRNNRSEEIVTFWFSMERSDEVKDKSLLSFNQMLSADDHLKVVPLLFYTALLYHIAKLMNHKGLALPGALTFSGTGSKLLSIISADSGILQKFSQKIFEKVYEQPFDRSGLTLYTDKNRPKEVTCKGALMMRASTDPVSAQEISYVYAGLPAGSPERLRYEDLNRPEVTQSVLKEAEGFIDFFFALDRDFGFEDYLNISPESLRIAKKELYTHLDTFLMNGVQRKLAEATSLDRDLEETLFFYPLIGGINKLAYAIHTQTGPVN
ncbi:cell division protein FtsA [Tellurirhabdus rosea]|uniref:cell division protein FtsA n=1 Tax=Tellurirhabdus rosea TaxID=2674997 RepID=UPI002258736E|nr:cell division protein FtsA [Tellurirhabdus rosea]